jgi:hypothetical protein
MLATMGLGVDGLQGHPLSIHQVALPEAVCPDQFLSSIERTDLV